MRDRSDEREKSLETGAAEDRVPVASAAQVLRRGADVRPEARNDLQRTVGNQAVTRLLGNRTGTSAPAGGRLSRKHKEFPVAGVGSPGPTLLDWESSDDDDTNVWFDWSATWVDADRTGSIDLGRYGKTPGFAD